jgi:hypothetical protein
MFMNLPMIICKNSHIVCKKCLDKIAEPLKFRTYACPYCKVRSKRRLAIEFKFLFTVKDKMTELNHNEKLLNDQVAALRHKNKDLMMDNNRLTMDLSLSQIEALFADDYI